MPTLPQPLNSVVKVVTFIITFNRAENALKVSHQDRLDQLRLFFSKLTRVSLIFLTSEVTHHEPDREVFCVTFTTDPDQPIADDLIRAATNALTAEKIWEAMADPTKGIGCHPKAILVEMAKEDDGKEVEE